MSKEIEIKNCEIHSASMMSPSCGMTTLSGPSDGDFGNYVNQIFGLSAADARIVGANLNRKATIVIRIED